MRRGEIRIVDLEPARGSEADKRRPAVIVSNNAVNRAAEELGRGVVTIVPLTSNTARLRRYQVLIEAKPCGLRFDSKAQAEQVRAVAVERVGKLVGRLPPALQADLDRALRFQLDL